MDAVDYQYINALSGRLRNFRQKGAKFEASCPLCGDSHKNSRKARLNFYEKNGKVVAFCFNECGGMSLPTFLDRYDQALSTEYKSQKFYKRGFKAEEIILEEPKKKEHVYDDTVFSASCFRVSTLSDHSHIKRYLHSRLIPEEFFDKMFYTNIFKAFVHSLGQDIDGREEGRLIIPFYDEIKKVFAFSARSLDKSSQLRYVNIVLDETKPKLFGLDRWDKSKKTYVFEGALDSLFILNSLATGGGDIVSAISDFPKENFVVVYDNEPRSQSTKKKIRKAIDQGYQVCNWPKALDLKDVNKMVQEGMKPLDIKEIIDQNTNHGLKAFLALGGS